MPDTNDTDAILAKVRSGELSAGDAAALIANLHAASYKAMQDAQTAQALQPEPPAPQAASQPGMSQQAPGRRLPHLAISRRFRLCRHMPLRRPMRLPRRRKRRFRSTLRHLQRSIPPPMSRLHMSPAASEPHPVYDQPSPP